MSPVDVTIAGLFSYPVKSCRAIAHDEAVLATSGLLGDRSWMIVDARAAPARFVTQRECPELATIVATLADDGELTLSQTGGTPITISRPSVTQLLRVAVWKSDLVAVDAGDDAASWLARATGRAMQATRLVMFHPDAKRTCNSYYAGNSGAHTMFADGYPLLVASSESLRDLNTRMRRTSENALPMSRFRPNVVLAGLPAWDEDFVETVAIGDVLLKLVKPCVRCEVTTTDQYSGARLSNEPLTTLARLRNNPDLGGVTFGWNAIVLQGGTVHVGAKTAVNYRFDDR